MVQVGELDEIVLRFVVGGYETLDQLDRDLLVRQENPSSRGRRARIVCAIYRNEGTCGCRPQEMLEGPQDVVGAYPGAHASVAGEEQEAEAEPAPAPTPEEPPAARDSDAFLEPTA